MSDLKFVARSLFCVLLAGAVLLLPVVGQAAVVRMQTSLGVVDIELFEEQAPLTVTNFLNYVTRGAYNSTFIHRSMPRFIIQGGGYALIDNRILAVKKDPPVSNEFSHYRSNVRGTVAMAKADGDPDSATSEWFINLADNSANLDYQNEGFTVFGRVMGNGMAIFDEIAKLQRVNAGGAFANLPLLSNYQGGMIRAENLVFVNSVTQLPTSTATSESDRLFNYLEATFPAYISPASQPSATLYGYYYRYYPQTGAYIATMENVLYYLGPLTAWTITPLGSQTDWVNAAIGAGY